MSARPLIFITNDDGIDSPGLLAAVEAVYDMADLIIAAPLTQQTGMGRAQYGRPDARLERRELLVGGQRLEAFACDACPARVVGHALTVMPDCAPDLLISGINYGENLGASVTGSGTVGAAIEGACRGIPSLAASLETPISSHFDYMEHDWNAVQHFLRHYVEQVLEKGLPPHSDILKLDVPENATPATPCRLTRLSRNVFYRRRIADAHLESLLGETRSVKYVADDEPDDTDVYAIVTDKVVSVTPMTLDLTAHTALAGFDAWSRSGAGRR